MIVVRIYIYICTISNVSLVRRVAKRFGLRVVGDEEEWTIYWTDLALPDRVNEIRPFQVFLSLSSIDTTSLSL